MKLWWMLPALLVACGESQSVEDADAGATPRSVTVSHAGEDSEVDLSVLADPNLAAIVGSALGGASVDGLVATDFIGSDGFSPRSKGNCADLLPVDAATLARGHLDPSTRNLSWDEALQYPGCMSVRDVATIVVAEAPGPGADAAPEPADAAPQPDAGPPSGKSVVVTFGGPGTEVSLDDPTPVDFEGASAVRVADVVALALPGEAVDSLQLVGVVGSDGFNPAERGGCAGNFPIEGAQLAQGYLARQTRDIGWDAALGFPPCMAVDDVAELLIEVRGN